MFYAAKRDPDCPPDGWRSLIAKAVLSRAGIKKVSFLPMLLNEQMQPEVPRHEDPPYADAVSFMDWMSERYGHKFAINGDEIIVHA